MGLRAPKGAAPQAQSTAWRNYTNANCVNRLALDGDAVSAARSGGVVHCSRTEGTYVKHTPLDRLSSNDVLAINAARRNCFGTNGDWVSEFNGQGWTTYTTADGLANNYVYAVAIDAAGHKWFGTGDGVGEFDGQGWTTYTTANGLAHNRVHAIAIDAAGHKWFATEGGGVSEFDGPLGAWPSGALAEGEKFGEGLVRLPQMCLSWRQGKRSWSH